VRYRRDRGRDGPGLERPIVLLTSDLDVMKKLTGEPGRPAKRRIAVVRV